MMTSSKNMMIRPRVILFFALLLISATIVNASEANILNVDFKNEGNARYTFNVTVQHEDKGWNHYVDRWEVLTPDGQIISIRVLRHPHVKEQPFTRSLPFVAVPEDIKKVIIRAHCSVDGFGGNEIEVFIPK